MSGISCQITEQEFSQSDECDAMSPSDFLAQPNAPGHESIERRILILPDERGCLNKITAVDYHVPVPGEAPQPLHGRKVDELVAQDFIGRLRGVNHFPLCVMTRDRGASKALEYSDLDFMGTVGKELVETLSETFEGLAGQTGDQIRMDMDAGLFAQEPEVIRQPCVILPAADTLSDLGVEGLDSHLELEGASGELADQLAQWFGEAVGDHFEVQEKPWVLALQKKVEYRAARVQVQVESAVNELELAHATIHEQLQLPKKQRQLELAHWDIE
jgi:hypothetical protein